jgi:hypothetical protein
VSRRHRSFFDRHPQPRAEVPLVLAAPEVRVTYCTRLVNYDARFWRCACGASGRVRVSPDGIPAGPESFRHTTGGEPC